MLSHIFFNTAINVLQMLTGGEPPVKKKTGGGVTFVCKCNQKGSKET